MAGGAAAAAAAARRLRAEGYEPWVACAGRAGRDRLAPAAAVIAVPDPGADPPGFVEGVVDAALKAGAAAIVPACGHARTALGRHKGMLPRGVAVEERPVRATLAPGSPARPQRTLLVRLQPVAARTGAGPLGPAWRLLHEAVMRLVAAYVRRLDSGAAVYVKGGFARGDAVVGISDIDLAAVVPGPVDRVSDGWQRLCRRVPPLHELVQHFWVYEERELRDVAGSTALTFGLAASPAGDRAAFLGPRPVADPSGLLPRPSIADGTPGWRRLAGPDRRPPPGRPTPEEERLAAWLELQWWWRLACAASVEPGQPHVPALCVKLVAEPARILLAVAHGERPLGRREVLRLAVARIPDEAEVFREALALRDRLSRRPEPPLDRVLPAFLRLASRVAALHEGLPATGVALEGDAADLIVDPAERRGIDRPRLLPLADWRACTRAWPDRRSLPDETFALVDGDPSRPGELAALSLAAAHGPYRALRVGGLIVMPTCDAARRRPLLRGIQCAASDPVSFAVAAGERVARFPETPGWSVAATARRAVAEHRAWLEPGGPCPPRQGWCSPQPDPDAHTAETVAMLLTAVRAARLLESVEAGAPALALTLTALADDGVTGAAVDAYRRRREGDAAPLDRVAGELRTFVRSLPAYSAAGG